MRSRQYVGVVIVVVFLLLNSTAFAASFASAEVAVNDEMKDVTASVNASEIDAMGVAVSPTVGSSINPEIASGFSDVLANDVSSGTQEESYSLARQAEEILADVPSPPATFDENELTLSSVELYREDFDAAGDIPENWTLYSEGPNIYPWKMVLDSGDDYHAECESYSAGFEIDITEWLFMDAGINCTAFTNIQVRFQLTFLHFNGGEFAQFLYSTSADYPVFTEVKQWAFQDFTGTQYLDLPLAAGDSAVYLAFVYHGTSDYYVQVDDLAMTGYVLGSDDAYEENDNITAAYNLSNLKQTWLSDIFGFGMQSDEDWYRIAMSPDCEQLYVELEFTDSAGNIDLEIYDDGGALISGSYGTADNEFMDRLLPSNDTYYLRVFQENAGNAYDLWWDEVDISTNVANWTIMIYLDCDNNLDSYWGGMPGELTNSGSSMSVQVLVLYDGDDDGDTQAFHILPGFSVPIPLTDINATWLDEVNMGNPGTLVSFSNYCVDRYPADRYMLVPQDHGGAWLGCCWDDTNGSDYLTLPELGSAFAEIKSHIGRNVDVVFFNDCLMSNMEVAWQMHPYMDYLVSSETISWTSTWTSVDYNILVNQLKALPGMAPWALAVNIVKEGTPVEDPVRVTQSISAINMSRISVLQDDLDALVLELGGQLDAYLMQIRNARALSDDFQGPNAGLWDRMIDLHDFVTNIHSLVPDSMVQALAATVMDDIGPPGGSPVSAVISTRDSASASFCNGLSIYFPWNATIYDPNYVTSSDFCADTQWDEFLWQYYGTPTEDKYEQNDDIASAYDLTGMQHIWLSDIDGFGMQADDDWYRIAVATYCELLELDILFVNVFDDLDVEVYDDDLNLVFGKYDDAANEYIEYHLPADGVYYLRIFGTGAGNIYDLRWDDVYIYPAEAEAEGPITDLPTHDAHTEVSYSWIGYPLSVDLYFTTDNGTSWSFAGSDMSVDGIYPCNVTDDSGTYHWLAAAIGGRSVEPSPPLAGTPPEAGPYIYDITVPFIVETTYSIGEVGVPTSAGHFDLNFSEEMTQIGRVSTTNLPSYFPFWLDSDTFRISYGDLEISTLYTLTFSDFFDLAENPLIDDDARYFITAGPSATATGPSIGPTSFRNVSVSYACTGIAVAVNIYYTTDSGMSWILAATDMTPDGYCPYVLPDISATYGWLVNTVASNTPEQDPPAAGTPPEAGPYILDVNAPFINATTFADGEADISCQAGRYDIHFNEKMLDAGSVVTDLPDPEFYRVDAYTYRINYDALLPLTAYTISLDGFQDVAGNSLGAVRSFVTANATATATGPYGGPANGKFVTITYDHTGSPASVDIYYTMNDGSNWTLAGTDLTVDGMYPHEIADGDGTYGWLAQVAGGNLDERSPPAPGTRPEGGSYILDTGLPTSSIGELPALIASQTFNVNVTASDPGGIANVTLHYRHNGGQWIAHSRLTVPPYSWAFDAAASGGDGSYEFYATACDVAGNAQGVPAASAPTLVDTTPPSLVMISPVEGQSFTPGYVTVSWEASDGGSGNISYALRMGDAAWQELGTGTSASYNLTEGEYRVFIRATDNAGNSAEVNCTFSVESGALPLEPEDSVAPSNAWQMFAAMAVIAMVIASLAYASLRRRH